MIEDNIKSKISELIARARGLVSSGGVIRDDYHFGACESWLVEANNVVKLAIPMVQNPYRQRIEKISDPDGKAIFRCVASVAEILRALLVDIDTGLLGDLTNKIRAATFDDFLDHAESYRHDNRKMEAGVIAGVVFEDTIRRIYRDKIADDKGQPLEDLINALAKQSIITGQQTKQAKVAAHVRTKATHAQWDEINLEGVDDTIKITKFFLREHLGG